MNHFSIFVAAALAVTQTLLCCSAALCDPAGAGTIDHGIRIIKDIPYTADSDPNRMLDLYLPEKSPGRLPLVILIHGGGWNAGDKADFGGVCRDFVRRGYASASLNYRLSRQAIFPAQIVDCKAAIRWLRAHSREYGFDPKRVVVGGHSAGGHLAAFLGVTNHHPEFDLGDNLNVSSDVQAVLWFAGVSDFVSRVQAPGFEGEASPGSGQSMLIGGAVLQNKDKAMAASPITYVTRTAAPFILYHGDSDRVVPVGQAQEMYAALRKAGVECELHLMPGADHGGPGYFSPSMLNHIDTFLNGVLKLGPSHTTAGLPGKGRYRISPVSAPDMVLDASPLAGTPSYIGIAAPTHSASQSWIFTPRGDGFYTIHPSDHPDLALTVAAADTAAHGDTAAVPRVTVAPDRGLDTQLWLLPHDAAAGTLAFSPRSNADGALDDFSGNATPAARIDIWPYNGSDVHLQWVVGGEGK